MKTVVPDASVILKWVLETEQEPDFDKAIHILDQFLDEKIRILLPTLWRYEVGNILGLKHPRHAQKMMHVLLAHQFEEVPLEEAYCLEILALLSETKGITFYDASYHIIALRNKGIYVTSDYLYYRVAHKKGSIVLLKNWK